MKVRIFVEAAAGATYDDQLRMAQVAQDAGFDGFFRSDHYLATSGDGHPGPTDAWLTLAALSRETENLRLGTLLSSATFRPPGVLAVIAAQVDQMSGGRVELGLGAGWYEREHLARGIPFPPRAERFDRLAEQLAIVTGLWATPADQVFNFRGQHYDLFDTPALPQPVQQLGPPIIIGGRGAKRTPDLAARYANEYNVPFAPIELTAGQYDRVRAACSSHGRNQPPIFSAGLVVYCGRTDAEMQHRSRALRESTALPTQEALVGSPDQVVDRIGQFAEIGAQRVYLRMDLDDPEHAELIGSEVLPQVAAM
jgi:F420-dependent oxidoreductase-like protein